MCLKDKKAFKKHGNALNNNWVIIHIEMSVFMQQLMQCWNAEKTLCKTEMIFVNPVVKCCMASQIAVSL